MRIQPRLLLVGPTCLVTAAALLLAVPGSATPQTYMAAQVWPTRQVAPQQMATSRLAGDLRTRVDLLRARLAVVQPSVSLRPGQLGEWATVLVQHGVLADADEAAGVLRSVCGQWSQDPGAARQAACWIDLLAWAHDALVQGAALGERSQAAPRHRKHFTAGELAERRARELNLGLRLLPDVATALAMGQTPVATMADAWLAPGAGQWPQYRWLVSQLAHYRAIAGQPQSALPKLPIAAPYAYKVPAQVRRWLRDFDATHRAVLAQRLCLEGYCPYVPPQIDRQPRHPAGPGQPAAPQSPARAARAWTLPGDKLTSRETARTVQAAGALSVDPPLSLNPPLALDAELTAQLQAWQADHGLRVTGLVDAPTLAALRVPMDQRVRQLRLALQRIRDTGMPRAPHFLVANIPSFRLDEWRGQTLHDSRAIQVGIAWERKHGRRVPGRRTPLLTAQVRTILVDPAWFVPGSILAEVNEEFAKDPDYARRNGFRFRIDKRTGKEMLVMDAGTQNLLGQVKFNFPNPHLVFAHDTTSKWRFLLPDRMTSHGCVRVHAATALARSLLAYDQGVPWPQEKWDALRRHADEKHIRLRQPLLIHLVYWTADATPDGHARFYRDAYKLDDSDWAQFQRSVAARSGATVAAGAR